MGGLFQIFVQTEAGAGPEPKPDTTADCWEANFWQDLSPLLTLEITATDIETRMAPVSLCDPQKTQQIQEKKNLREWHELQLLTPNQIKRLKRGTAAATRGCWLDQDSNNATVEESKGTHSGFNYPASLSVFNKQPANPADGCHAGGLFGERASPACVYWRFWGLGYRRSAIRSPFFQPLV